MDKEQYILSQLSFLKKCICRLQTEIDNSGGGGGSSTRFGFLTEDSSAAEDRSFNAKGNSFEITGFNAGIGFINSNNQAYFYNDSGFIDLESSFLSIGFGSTIAQLPSDKSSDEVFAMLSDISPDGDDNTDINSYFVTSALSSPDPSPTDGQAFRVLPNATGDFSGHDNQLATWIEGDGIYDYLTPQTGDYVYQDADGKTLEFNGTVWKPAKGIPILNNGNKISSGVTIGTRNNKGLTFKTNNTNRIVLTNTGVLNYTTDKSGSYTNRSLVDKEYVDTHAGSGSIPTLAQVLGNNPIGAGGTSNSTGGYPIQMDDNGESFLNNALSNTAIYFDSNNGIQLNDATGTKSLSGHDRTLIDVFGAGVVFDWGNRQFLQSIDFIEANLTINAADLTINDGGLTITNTLSGAYSGLFSDQGLFLSNSDGSARNVVVSGNPTSNRTATLQDRDGTIAYLDDIVAGSQDFQSVTDIGATSTHDITANSFNASDISGNSFNLTAGSLAILSSSDPHLMSLNNSNISFRNTTSNKYIQITNYDLELSNDDGSAFVGLSSGNPTTNRIVSLQDKNGVIAYLDDITGGGSTPDLQAVTDVGSITANPISSINNNITSNEQGGGAIVGVTSNPSQEAAFLSVDLGDSGVLNIVKPNGAFLKVNSLSLSTNRVISFPNKDGTVAIVNVADDFSNDSTASAGGIVVGGLYHTSGTVKIRLT